MEKMMRSKTRDSVGVDNGEYLAKMPTASADQLNIAKILSKPEDDLDLRKYVSQLQELTECTEDQAVTALYDCENNLERAVELLLDKLRFGTDEEWYTTGKKQTRPKPVLSNGSPVTENLPLVQGDNVSEKNASRRTNAPPKEDKDISKNEISSKRLDNRRRGSTGAPKVPVEYSSRRVGGENKPQPVSELREAKPQQRLPGSDAWDPYTEYGGWGGEAIEVINSNASISTTLQEDVLPNELLVDTETAKPSSDQPVESDVPSVNGDCSPSSLNLSDPDSIFVTQALSKPPPKAFTNFPDMAVFIAPEVLPSLPCKWPFKFAGETCVSFRSTSIPDDPSVPLSPKDNITRTQVAPTSTSKRNAETEHREYSFSHQVSSPRPKTAEFESSGNSGTSRNLLENPTKPDTEPMNANSFSSNQFQSTSIAPKLGSSFPSPAKPQSSGSFVSDGTSGQPNFLESSLKSYILDNLPKEMSKLSAGESPHNKVSQFGVQSQAPQTQVSSSSFASNQISSTATPQSSNKSQISHLPAHSSVHSSQQPSVSSASQSQQATSVPPGMPHFIGQFAPQAYMFNLPNNSGNAPAIFDLDQFQLLQQQRMFYDMHLQHQAATTAQSLLTSTADASTSGKSTTHSMPGAMGHVTAANAAGLRPEVLASAMGHAPQMMPTGHPYFSYPGFVLMNGYSNAFLNQQQQQQSGQDAGQNQGGSTHGTAPITQHQHQPSSSAQSYSGLKSGNSNLPGYDDLFDMKYGDPSKQVGFKNTGNTNYGSFQGNPNEIGSKIQSGAHSASGMLAQGFNTNAGQPFSPQFYPPYLTAAAMAVAAAAAASSQQHQQSTHGGNVSASQANPPSNSGSQTGNGPNTLHQSNGAAQPMSINSSATNIHPSHHQRPVMPQQY